MLTRGANLKENLFFFLAFLFVVFDVELVQKIIPSLANKC